MIKIPNTLFKKMCERGLLSREGWNDYGDGSRQTNAYFRLKDNRIVCLLFDSNANVTLWLDPGSRSRGEPLDPEFFDFSGDDIVAQTGRRKIKKGWFPWQYQWEDYDLVSIDGNDS